jgi:hypothetical protein
MTANEPSTPIHQMSAAEAGTKLAELQVAYDGAAPTTTPQTAAEARARLAGLTANEAWANLLMTGDAATRREYEALTRMVANGDATADAVANTPAGEPLIEVTSGPDGLTGHNLRSAVAALREDRFSDLAIQQVMDGTPQSASDVALAQERRARAMRDPAWVKSFLEGDQVAKADMTLWNAVLTNGAAEGK